MMTTTFTPENLLARALREARNGSRTRKFPPVLFRRSMMKRSTGLVSKTSQS